MRGNSIMRLQNRALFFGSVLFASGLGAACSSGVIEASHVLEAMRLDPGRVASAIRISFGRTNTEREVGDAADALSRLTNRLAAQPSFSESAS